MRSSTKVILIVCGVTVGGVGALILGSLLLETLAFVGYPYATSYYYRLEYDNMHFTEGDRGVDDVTMGSFGLHDWRVPSVYAEFPKSPGKIYFLPALTEASIGKLSLSERTRDLGGKPETTYVLAKGDPRAPEDGGYCQVSFYAGKPAGFSLERRTGIRIYAVEGGEYLELPCKRADVIRVFGKPIKIERKEAEHIFH